MMPSVFGYSPFRYATTCTNGWICKSMSNHPIEVRHFQLQAILRRNLIQSCLHHNMQEWLQLHIFYNGLDGSLRAELDCAFGGAFMNNTYE
ncbi:Retrotransposon gag protein [Gossypium australe]|uniref:Retrotransposon gag protein n=1 Tax=Gossypium australe TaxID=47621 RepID=A0A5B6UCW3_9ROSI|nr:Retrotransposon gag protein [Gossypium australe]